MFIERAVISNNKAFVSQSAAKMIETPARQGKQFIDVLTQCQVDEAQAMAAKWKLHCPTEFTPTTYTMLQLSYCFKTFIKIVQIYHPLKYIYIYIYIYTHTQ